MKKGDTPVSLSSVSLGVGLGVPIWFGIRLARVLGFTGLEILITNQTCKKLAYVEFLANNGYSMTWQRWWHGDEFASNLLTRIGVFPPRTSGLKDVLPPTSLPVVVSSYIWEERGDAEYVRVQPACTSYAGTAMPFDTLVACIQTEGTRIVFDVMHILEYASGGTQLSEDPHILLARAKEWFHALRDVVDEIHVYDFCHITTHGKDTKLFPGDGIFPVWEFLEYVASSGWRGLVVWEIDPRVMVLKPWSIFRFRSLTEHTIKIFSQ